jgi:hypothetical protein
MRFVLLALPRDKLVTTETAVPGGVQRGDRDATLLWGGIKDKSSRVTTCYEYEYSMIPRNLRPPTFLSGPRAQLPVQLWRGHLHFLQPRRETIGVLEAT